MMMRMVAVGVVVWGVTLGGGESVLGAAGCCDVDVPWPAAGVLFGFTPSLPLLSASLVGGAAPGPDSWIDCVETVASSCDTLWVDAACSDAACC